MSRPRIAVLGTGAIGTVHAQSIARSGAAELALVADTRPGAAAIVAQDLDCEHAEVAKAAFTRHDVDGVVIATPVDGHLALIDQAARAGLAIFCEKPLARTLADCSRATAIAREHDVPLHVGFHRRFDADWKILHDAVASGDVGEVLVLKSTLRDMTPPSLDYIRTSGGYFADAFIHDFDAARWLVGEVETVTAVGVSTSKAFEDAGDYDNAAVLLRFTSGALGILDGSRLGGYGYDCTTELVGTQQTLRVENRPANHVRRLSGGEDSSAMPRTYLQRFREAYVAEIEAFAAVVAKAADPPVGGWDALMALAIAIAAERSSRQDETVSLHGILAEEGVEARSQL